MRLLAAGTLTATLSCPLCPPLSTAAGFFWMRQLRPFMRRAKQESRRVAEMLSQLPPDMVRGLLAVSRGYLHSGRCASCLLTLSDTVPLPN